MAWQRTKRISLKLMPWSRIKNELLAAYIKPYFAILSSTGRKTLYVDCFAGKGRFDDGADGSPFIAIKLRNEAFGLNLAKSTSGIELAFIEKYYAKDLETNIHQQFPNLTGYSIFDGCFEEHLLPFIKNRENENLFLYIDPFGIKSLQFPIFEAISKCKRFPSIEVLMNFNTFGFIRSATSVLQKEDPHEIQWERDYFSDNLKAISDFSPFDVSLKTIDDVNGVAHGTYWIDIIRQFSNDPKGYLAAEKAFAAAYRDQLAKVFSYVLKMPIGKKDGSIPEYCMYFMTNHSKGCVIMADNMMKRSDTLRTEVHQDGQLELFGQDIENNIIDLSDVRKKLIATIERYTYSSQFKVRIWCEVEHIIAHFYAVHGVLCSSKDLRRILRKLEDEHKIKVQRTPKGDGTKTVNSKSFDSKALSIRIIWSVDK